jgi:DNA (cytosine-5)-methyltransferase 1
VRSIELFAGAGGLGLGSIFAGAEPQMIVERDRWCCETLRTNAKDGAMWDAPFEGDIRSIDFTSYVGTIDLVTGGPPCQPFSMGGKHRAHEDHRDMWSEAVRTVRETKPRAFVFENVKGLTRSSFSDYFSYITLQLTYPELVTRGGEHWPDHLARLERHHSSGVCTGLQYQVIPPRVLNAANFGVPQRRERVFFVGFRSDLNADWAFPQGTHSREALVFDQSDRGAYFDLHGLPRRMRQPVDKRFETAGECQLKPWRTVRDAMVGLPDPSDKTGKAWLNHRFQSGAKIYPGHTGSPIDLPAKALKAGVHGVPGGENMVVLDDGTVRYFTVRESARLQTFPDDYAIEGSWSEAMRQLGNAVPVELARIVTGSVICHLETLNG